MQIPLYLDEDLAQKVNERLPRNIKVAPLGRWLLRGIVLTPQELEKVCQENQDEADIIGPYLQEALQKLFNVTNRAKETKSNAKQ